MKTKIRQITWTGKCMHDAAYLLAAGMLVLGCCCCGDHTTVPPEPEPVEPVASAPEPPAPEPPAPELPAPEHLTGTKWKLAGYFDVQSRILTEAEPKNCEDCYTLVFESDSVAWGYSIINVMGLHLWPKLAMGIATMVGDRHNGNAQLLYDAMRIVESYAIENGEMKIYYNNKRNYLLYKLVQQ